ncbi:Gldg family protein [Synechocystis sp. LKSZ1]|uniref:GldG family protein n=1 Tax=Synechocystis sp. LKSZ1 TaxID=3144951 RepID=UPI00336BCB7D
MSLLRGALKALGKYGYLLAIVLITAGGITALVTGQWPTASLLFLGFGAMILGAWLMAKVSINNPALARRSTQAGTNALLTTAAILILIGVINFLAFRYPLSLDLTENQQFTLSSQSQTLVKSLEKPVKVWVFDSDPSSKDKALLKNYQRYSGQVSFEFVDPDQKPRLVKKFNVKAQGDVFVEYGDKKQLVQTLISFNQREPLSEIKLTNAIAKIRQARTFQAYILQGHGEAPLNTSKEGLSEAVDSLKNKGFEVNPLNLGEQGAIPPKSDLLVLAGPQRKLLEAEVKLLQAYSAEGGNLLVMVPPEVNPGLEPFLESWGVKLDERTVVDLSGSGQLLGLGPTAPLITHYGEHPITKEFQNGISIFPLSRPIATTKVEGVRATTLLEASENMLAQRELTENFTYNPKTDLRGPFDLGVALERTAQKSTPSPSPALSPSPSPAPNPSPTPSATKPARLVVIGNALFATNEWFNEQLNGDVFLNSAQWLVNREEQALSIRPKEPTNRRITLTPFQASLLGWLSWVIIPLLGLGLAIGAWWRRQ